MVANPPKAISDLESQLAELVKAKEATDAKLGAVEKTNTDLYAKMGKLQGLLEKVTTRVDSVDQTMQELQQSLAKEAENRF